jgi:two-component system OmpR family response regulator
VSAPQPPAAIGESNQLRTVLYVDDDPDIREIVEMALGLIGTLTVSICASGTGPEGDSYATVPVIFVTAKAMPQEIARFRELGAAGVIAKHFDPMDFGEQVLAAREGISHQ